MKSIKLTYLLVGALAMTMMATGCKKKPTPITSLPGYRSGSARDTGMTGLDPGLKLPSQDTQFGNPLPDFDPTNMNQNRDKYAAEIVYFDLDSSVVKNSEKSKVATVASQMKSAPPGAALLVEGHCDERGTEEYNRTLGEQRALALREALISAGADGSRITTMSFGEDKPAVQGHDESAWRQNRRGEFIELTPK